MKINLLFCAYDGKNIINGINTWLLNLLPSLKKKDYEVHVLFMNWAPVEECMIYPFLQEKGIKCSIFPLPHYTEHLIKHILYYINQHQIDIFIPGHMPPALFAIKWLQDVKIPSIAVMHNDDKEYNALIQNFTPVDGFSSANVIVSVSDLISKKIREISPEAKIVQIPCGANIPSKKNLRTKAQKFRIVYIGRLEEAQKNISLIATAFCELVKVLPNVEAYIYGSGPDEKLVNDIIISNGTPKNLVLTGNLPPYEIQKELTKAHIVVLFSKHEGLPVSLMEAMAYGAVPICSVIESGLPELLILNQTGLFVENIDDFIEKVSFLEQNYNEWNRLSTNARNLILSKFSSEINVIKWDVLLKKLYLPRQQIRIKIPYKLQLPKVDHNMRPLDLRSPHYIYRIINKIKRMFGE